MKDLDQLKKELKELYEKIEKKFPRLNAKYNDQGTFGSFIIIERKGEALVVENDELDEIFTVSLMKNLVSTKVLETKNEENIFAKIREVFFVKKDLFEPENIAVQKIHALRIPTKNPDRPFYKILDNNSRNEITIVRTENGKNYGEYNGVLYPIVKIVQADFGKGYKTMVELQENEVLHFSSEKRKEA